MADLIVRSKDANVDETYRDMGDGTFAKVVSVDVESITGGGDASAANQAVIITDIGAVDETAPATDIASSGLNGRLQRIAQRVTSLIALLPASLGQKAKAASLAVTLASDQDALPITDNSGSLTVDGTIAATQSGDWAITDITGTITLPSGAATAVNQTTTNTALADIETAIEAPAHAEDAAHASGDLGFMLLAVRNDTGTALAGTEGDYIPLGTDLNGNLRIVGTVAATLDAASLAALETVSVATIGAGTAVIGKVDQGTAGESAWPVTLDTGLNYLDDNVLVVPAVVNAVAATMTRPGDTTPYQSGDLVANSTTAGSVVPLSFDIARVTAGNVSIRRMRIRKSGTSVTTCTLRLHLYGTAPTVANGDNGAWSSTQSATYYGALEAIVDKAFSDGAVGTGAPLIGTEILASLASGTTIYGLLEARSAYTPANAETFAVTLEAIQG